MTQQVFNVNKNRNSQKEPNSSPRVANTKPRKKVHQRDQQQTQMTEETSELEIKSIRAVDQREER